MQKKCLSLAALAMGISVPAFAETVAYWRFETGPADTDVIHTLGAGEFEPTISDVSGNGNHLSVWMQGDYGGSRYRTDVPFSPVPQTGATNNFSVQNTGADPSMFTTSSVSMPSGVDVETMTPTAFTVEASWKPDQYPDGYYRTIVGRDAEDVVTGDFNASALYLQATPDNSMQIWFCDVAGNAHYTFTAPGFVQDESWYNVAGVSDGTTLSLYVNGSLAASTPIVSADPRLAVGVLNGGDWHAGEWSIGRGLWSGVHVDRAYGLIDEVRISNTALSPDQLLMNAVPEPAIGMVMLAGVLQAWLRRGRSPTRR
jgi:hypothetical protein